MKVPKVRGAGLKTNGPHWAHYILEIVLPELAVLRETVIDRALPSFDDLEREADEASDAALERMGRHFNPEADPADSYEAAQDEGIIYYQLRSSARQAVLNLFAVALHHFLEQKLIFLLRRELLPQESEDDRRLFKREAVVQAFADQEIDLGTFPEWPKVEELRLAANVAKHADGTSAEQLWELRPEIFTPQFMRKDMPTFFGRFRGKVWAPMSGEDLFVAPDDLAEFFDQVEAFLRRLADHLYDVAGWSRT